MNIELEMKDFVTEWNSEINKNEIFYRYNIDGNLVWFSQMQDSGNIYSVSVRLNKNLTKYFEVWVRCDDDILFYPNDITIEINHAYIKQEDVDRIVSDIHYIDRLCDMIMSIFKMKEHYDLWYEYNKRDAVDKHKDHHCMCCGKYIEKENLQVCDKCASEYKF
jgi:hypothetical protein